MMRRHGSKRQEHDASGGVSSALRGKAVVVIRLSVIAAVAGVGWWAPMQTHGEPPQAPLTVEQVLARPAYAYPDWMAQVQAVMEANPDHPKMLELRFYRLKQQKGAYFEDRALRGTDAGKQYVRGIVRQMEQLATEAGEGTDLQFRALEKAGHTMFHVVSDYQEALRIRLGLIDHPTTRGDAEDLAAALRRVRAHRLVAQAAHGVLWHNVGEREQELLNLVDRHARAAMDYDFRPLCLTDMRWFDKFWREYEAVAGTYLAVFHDDLAKMTAVQIPGVHESLYAQHQAHLKQLLGADRAENQLAQGVATVAETVELPPDAVLVEDGATPPVGPMAAAPAGGHDVAATPLGEARPAWRWQTALAISAAGLAIVAVGLALRTRLIRRRRA
jgi:hypothetical protein